MNKSLQQVAEFHTAFEHPILESALALEPLKIRQLRIKLLFEELAELAEASDCRRTLAELADRYCIELAEANGGIENTVEEQCETVKEILDSRNIHDGDNVNKKEELDALCDIQYVLNGKILTSGLHKIFDLAFNQVHYNNMAKAHSSEEHAKETTDKLSGVFTVKKKTLNHENVFILMNDHGKVIKPHDHKKVELNLNDLLSEADPNFPG